MKRRRSVIGNSFYRQLFVSWDVDENGQRTLFGNPKLRVQRAAAKREVRKTRAKGQTCATGLRSPQPRPSRKPWI